MNTQFIYISNIPSNCKPVLLLHELKNKWARMLYLENTFSGLRDAFVYNPTDNYEHFCRGVQNLRNKLIDDVRSLSVYFVWFPPANVFITTMIPAGASMLSYLFVENLHKDVIPTDVIYDLPLQVSDIKNWDIPERTDKCIIIKLPPTCNTAMRSFVLGTLRNRPVRGLPVRVSELIISEENQLSSILVPRSVKMDQNKHDSYLSNFFYLHDIPFNLTVKMIIDIAKTDNIRGARVFFVETNNNMKYGFMYVPRSLPHVRFLALLDKIRCAEFPLSETEIGRVKINITWFQPCNAEAPRVTDDGQMVLTEYLYLSGVPPGINTSHLTMAAPWPVKMYLFPVNECATQIGFVVLRGLGEHEARLVTTYLRHLDFNGAKMLVDEVYIHCHDLSADIKMRPFQLQPRLQTTIVTVTGALKRAHNDDGCGMMTNNGCESDMALTTVTLDDGSLMKTDFICVDNLPKNMAKAALIFDIGRTSDGCIIIPNNEYSTAFIYFPDCDIDSWRNIVRRLSLKTFSQRQCSVYEVFLKTDFANNNNNNQDSVELKDSNVLFVYNIAREVDNDEILDLGPAWIQYCELLETTSGSKSAFILLRDGCTKDNKLAFLYNIRKKFLRGKPVYADLLKLSRVEAVADVSTATNDVTMKKQRCD